MHISAIVFILRAIPPSPTRKCAEMMFFFFLKDFIAILQPQNIGKLYLCIRRRQYPAANSAAISWLYTFVGVKTHWFSGSLKQAWACRVASEGTEMQPCVKAKYKVCCAWRCTRSQCWRKGYRVEAPAIVGSQQHHSCTIAASAAETLC